MAFYNNLVLIYYQCGLTGDEVCGDVYSIDNIKVKLTSLTLQGNCDDKIAVRGTDGFLYLCFNQTQSSITWQNWYTDDGVEFVTVSDGTISNVTIPNTVVSENFQGGLIKAFSTGRSTYSVIMGAFYDKPAPKKNFYTPPIEVYAYFLSNQTQNLIDPHPIYTNPGQPGVGVDSIQFAIQVCNNDVSGNGYKCLFSLKREDPVTRFISVQFLQTGEVINYNEFDVTPAEEISVSINLSYGGYCIGVENNDTVNGLIYDGNGNYNGTWDMPESVDYYNGKVGMTPHDIMYGVEKINQTTYWRMFYAQL